MKMMLLASKLAILASCESFCVLRLLIILIKHLVVANGCNYFDYVVVDEDSHFLRAHRLYNGGNYKQALELCSSVYERNPLRTDNLLLLGAIYYQVMWLLKQLIPCCVCL